MLENVSFNHYRYNPRAIIGSSEIAALIAVGCGKQNLKTAAINYGGDSSYMAYLCDDRTDIPDYYEPVFTFTFSDGSDPYIFYGYPSECMKELNKWRKNYCIKYNWRHNYTLTEKEARA